MMSDLPEPSYALLTDEEFEQLDHLLDDDNLDSEAMDAVYAHGFMVAQALSPQPLETADLIATVCNGETSLPKEAYQQLSDLLIQLRQAATSACYRGYEIELPVSLNLDEGEIQAYESPLCDWCAGFVESVLLQEALWFSKAEQDIAELLLPLMALSGLFEEEAEVASLQENFPLLQQMALQVPQILIDLYVVLHAPEEKPKPKLPASSKAGKKKTRTRAKKS